MRYRRIRLSDGGPIRWITLSGERFGAAEARELEDAARALQHDDSVRVVVMDSDGPDFVPGLEVGFEPLELEVDPVAALMEISTPVIASMSGRVESVGLELGLAADLRVVGESFTARMPDLRSGRLPCWGGTQTLPRVVGLSAAMWILICGEPQSAADALRIGLVHEVGPDLELKGRVSALASRLAEAAPLATRYLKEAIREGLDLPLRAGMRLEGDLNTMLMVSDDRSEGIQAFLEKRPPRFLGS